MAVSDVPHHRSARHPGIWIAVASALVVLGVAGSMLAAHVVAQNDRQRARSAFTASANEVASKLVLVIEHEEDLVVGARAFIAGNPNASQAAFLRWTTVVGAFERSPELEGGGEVAIVPASRLAAFAARQKAEPASPLPTGSSYQVLPPGRRPYYCLLALVLARRSQASAVPVGFDFCATNTELRTALFAARDSGENAYLPNRAGKRTELLIETPIYRGGVVPKTVAERRRTLIGAFATSVNPTIILATALQGHRGMAVEFRFDGGHSPVVFRSSAGVRGGQSATIDLGAGWTMRASGAALGGGVLADTSALALLLGGIVLSLLLGLLVFVLGTGRARALAMVREKTREVSYQALHDALTGLPNRALVLDRAERMLARAHRDPRIVAAALYVDIDRFKYVNDSFGHAAGDRLLRTVAERLQSVVRDQDTVGRLGGDEFVVLLEATTNEAPPDIIAERVIEVLRQPVVLEDGDRPFSASVSVGIAIGKRATADELLRDADLALYTAKAAGKDRAVLFEASMQRRAEDHRQLELGLDEAIQAKRFFLLYQPILDLSSREVVGVEALVRWRHPQLGVVQPDDFIPLAEETGRIMAIGRWVLDEACRQAAAWEAQGHRLGMSVNVSAYQLDRDGFADDVQQALETSQIAPSSLTLEITETALMRDVSAASERLKEIKALGVRIAIDDFGTGSSSLAYLREFSADSLKIDRTFIAEITDSGESAAIIHTLVQLGKLLGIDTLAEGIEEPSQLTELQREQCDQGQGFLFARPLDAPGIERFLARTPRVEHGHLPA
jgi:diguanylate cyclase (GGDEF)-like protein